MDILRTNESATVVMFQIKSTKQITASDNLAFGVYVDGIETTFHNNGNLNNFDAAYALFDRECDSISNNTAHINDVGFNL